MKNATHERKTTGREPTAQEATRLEGIAAGRGDGSDEGKCSDLCEISQAEDRTLAEPHRRTTSIDSECGRSDGISSSIVPVSKRRAADSSAAESTTI